ncbi:MAG TPA: type II toxin-antitoxin system VapC family toxin [Aliidongia sp.]|nr:type II toxin-antitoxin system VapC family toxin [Aliidongia sp.]
MTVSSSRQAIVGDASVALKWVCEEEGSDRAASLLTGRPLVAPALWLVETANALWRRVQRGELTGREADERIAALTTAPVRALDVQDLISDALKLACTLGHPVYDCLYLVAASRCQGLVITADRRFHAAAAGHAEYGAMIALL